MQVYPLPLLSWFNGVFVLPVWRSGHCFQDTALQDPLFSDEMGHHSQVGFDLASGGYVVGLQCDQQLLLC